MIPAPHPWYIWRSPFLVIMTPLCQQNQGTTRHNIQTLHNVFWVCIPFHSAHILLTYQRWLLPQIFCIFHTLMSLHRLFLPFYFSWQPPSIFYVYRRESSSSCFTVSSQRGGKCPRHSGRHLSDGTAPSLIIPDFLKTRRGRGSWHDYGEPHVHWISLFFLLVNGVICLKRDISDRPSKQKHLSFLSFPSLITHFLIKRNFGTTWLNFLCANPNSENPRKKGEWANKWHLVNKPDLESLVETQLKCCLFCEAFLTFPAMQLPCPSCPQGTLVIAHGVTTVYCVTMPSAELWAQLDPLGFFQFYIYSKQESIAYRYWKKTSI